MSKKSWSIRKARADDAEALAACMDAAYRPYMERLGDAPLPPMTVDYHEEIASYPVWVVEADATVVGGLVLMPEGDGMTVANVAVHPNFQGHGLGRSLMSFADEEAQRQGYTAMHLATHVLLTENIAFYEHLGWSETSRDDSRVYMKKML